MGQGNKTNTPDKIFYNNQELSEDNEKAKCAVNTLLLLAKS